MIVHLNGDTYRVQFIKEVEDRKRGRTTITTICKIFRHVGEKNEGDGKVQRLWDDIGYGVARQNPEDKYNHYVGKAVALADALDDVFDENSHVERCTFGYALAKEFGRE